MSSEVQFNLRIPSELKEKVKRAAETSGRSINSEAQYRLEKSFESSLGSTHIPTEELMMELSNRFKGFSIVMMENEDIKKAP